MSHFTVLVALEKFNAEQQDFRERLDQELAPFMENCCAEPERKYMEFYDKEEEMRKEYEERTIKQVKLSDGKLVFEWDEQFLRKPTKEDPFGLPKAPDDLPRVQVHVKDKYTTFESFAEDYHGYKKDDITGKYGYWQNPNAKWDWYEIGGRWAGYFLLKPGRKGFQGKQYNFEQAYPKSNRADICCKGDIDVEAIRSEAAERAKKIWDRVHEVIKGTPVSKTWEEVKYEHGIDPGGKYEPEKIEVARKAYWEQPRVKKFREFGKSKEGMELVDFSDGPDDYQMSREKYAQNARDRAIVTFAFVKDGKWFEQGNMGYWGMVSDEKDPETWNSVYTKMFDALADDTLLVVCDCHI